jgi:hypothetical protein
MSGDMLHHIIRWNVDYSPLVHYRCSTVYPTTTVSGLDHRIGHTMLFEVD